MKRFFAGIALCALLLQGQLQLVYASMPTSAEKTQVETSLLGMQKDAVAALKEHVMPWIEKGGMETGDFSFQVGLNDGAKKAGYFQIDVTSFKDVFSVMKLSREIEADVRIQMFGSGTETDYSNPLPGTSSGVSDFEPTKYATKAYNASASFQAHLHAWINQEGFYFQISNVTHETTGQMPERFADIKQLDGFLKSVKTHEGNTYFLPVDTKDMVNMMHDGVVKLKKALDLLEANSLLEAREKVQDGYQLGLKLATVKQIGSLFGISEKQVKKEMQQIMSSPLESLFYIPTSQGSQLYMYLNKTPNQQNKKTQFVLLEKTNNEYELSGTYIANTRGKNPSQTSASFVIQKHAVKVQVSERRANAWYTTKNAMNLEWYQLPEGKHRLVIQGKEVQIDPVLNNAFAMTAKNTYTSRKTKYSDTYSKTSTLQLKGKVNPYANQADLTMYVDGKKHAQFSMLPKPDGATHMNLEFNFSDFGTAIAGSMQYMWRVQLGEFPITTPPVNTKPFPEFDM